MLAQAFVSLWELLGFCEETNNNTPALNCASSQAFHDFSRDEETVCAQVVGGQDKALWSPQCVRRTVSQLQGREKPYTKKLSCEKLEVHGQ